jgi:hypothetical protein
MSRINVFVPISKVDEAQRLVCDTLTEETPDKSGEIFDYASGKSAVQRGLTKSSSLPKANPSAMFARDPVGGDADRLGDVPERILDHRAVAALAQQKAQGRPIGRLPDQVVGGREIEVELAKEYKCVIAPLFPSPAKASN